MKVWPILLRYQNPFNHAHFNVVRFMPQSMLAFLAMSMAIFISLNQKKAELRTNESILKAEIEIMANAVALEQMEIVIASTVWDDFEVWEADAIKKNFSLNDFQEAFDIAVSVQFIDQFGNPSITPTTTKEVLITVIHDRYELPMVSHARLIPQ